MLMVVGAFWPSTALALDPAKAITQYRRMHWTGEDGLLSNSALAVVQTRDGYIWVGTEEGLVRFDGVRFTAFTSATTPAIRHNRVSALCETSPGTLLIGTFGGGLVTYKQGLFAAVSGTEGLRIERWTSSLTSSSPRTVRRRVSSVASRGRSWRRRIAVCGSAWQTATCDG
jgi:ligand-binding sensor domain-containing protein